MALRKNLILRRPQGGRLEGRTRLIQPETETPRRDLSRDLELLAQLRDQRLDAAAVALDHRGELVALRHLHADAADIDIGDLVGTAADQIPVDCDAAAAGANDLAGDDRLVAVRAHAGDAERLAAVCAEPGAVGAHEIFLEQPEKILLFLWRGDPPIAAEHELADAGQIEIVPEQLTEAGLTLQFGDARAQHLDGLLAERADEGAGILRPCLDWHRKHQDHDEECANRSATSDHVTETSVHLEIVYETGLGAPSPPCTGVGLGRFDCS